MGMHKGMIGKIGPGSADLTLSDYIKRKQDDAETPKTYTHFEGNIDFYNDPKYREANKLHWQAIEKLKECGMKHNQACDWMRNWGYLEDGE